jgi:hypothetical protein
LYRRIAEPGWISLKIGSLAAARICSVALGAILLEETLALLRVRRSRLSRLSSLGRCWGGGKDAES